MPTTPLGLHYPAESDPNNVPADMQALAESIEAEISRQQAALTQASTPPCGMASAGAQKIIHRAAPTVTPLATQLLDTDNMVDLSAQPLGFTVRTAGHYLCVAHTQWNVFSEANHDRTCAVMYTAANLEPTQAVILTQVIAPQPATNITSAVMTCSIIAPFEAGALISIGANHNVGTTGTTEITLQFAHLMAIRVF